GLLAGGRQGFCTGAPVVRMRLSSLPCPTVYRLSIADWRPPWQKDRQLRIVRCEDPALKRMPEVKTGDRIAAADMCLTRRREGWKLHGVYHHSKSGPRAILWPSAVYPGGVQRIPANPASRNVAKPSRHLRSPGPCRTH